jgi:hypothetical protein
MENIRFYESIRDKLAHGCICECAIGNLIQNKGVKRQQIYNNPISWFDVVHVLPVHHDTYKHLKNEVEKQLLLLPYTTKEVILIEESFEGRKYKYGTTPECLNVINDPDGFKGLTNTIETLYQLEDWKEEESKVNLVEMCINR